MDLVNGRKFPDSLPGSSYRPGALAAQPDEPGKLREQRSGMYPEDARRVVEAHEPEAPEMADEQEGRQMEPLPSSALPSSSLPLPVPLGTPGRGRGSFPSKTACPVTRSYFMAQAQPLVVKVEGVPLLAMPKQTKSGSLGWGMSCKSLVMIGHVAVKVQVGLNITIINSKLLPPD